MANEVGGVALAIDAKDEAADECYARFGAVPLPDDPLPSQRYRRRSSASQSEGVNGASVWTEHAG